MAIKDWPQAERPREKLIERGAAQLSDAELLAVFLRIGVRGKSAVALARECIAHFGSLNALFAADKKAFSVIPGMGMAKYAQLQAVLEMARRALGENLAQRPVFNSPKIVRDYLRLHLGQTPHEVFIGLFLDSANRLIATHELAHGTINESAVYPREVVKCALSLNAAAVLFAHNHPGGQLNPSQPDIALTRALQAALATIDIRVLDHFIVTAEGVLSLAETGQI